MLEGFPSDSQRSPARMHAIDYMAEQVCTHAAGAGSWRRDLTVGLVLQLDMLPQKKIASRLTLNCLTCDPTSWKLALPDEKITFIDVRGAP